MVKHQDTDWLEDRWFQIVDRITGVCCLSSTYDLDYQWNNYAKEQSGVCIEIEASQHAGGINPRAVLYDDTRPTIFIDRFIVDAEYRDLVSYEVLTRKKTEFQKENEYRILTNHDEMPDYGINHTFDNGVFKKLYFGKQISEENVRAVISLTEKSPIEWELIDNW